MTRVDVAIVGLGAFGSAAAFHASRAGRSVIAFDRFTPPHDHGSHHGDSRIIREAYFEDPAFVPLVHRAYALWDDLQRESKEPLWRTTGGLLMGPPEGEVVPGVRRAAAEHGLSVEPLDGPAIVERFPGFQLHPSHEAVFEPRAGLLHPEVCVRAHLKGAKALGARIRAQEPVEGWSVRGDGLHVWTPEGDYIADRLIVAGGAWAGRLLGRLDVPLAVERQVQCWFTPAKGNQDWSPDHCPIFAVETEPGSLFYGLPDVGRGVKAAIHHRGAEVDPDQVERTVTEEDVDALRADLARFLPALDRRPRDSVVCLYTNTPDHKFVIDRHPDHPEVVIACGGSGHGFKFSAAIGEAAANLALDKDPDIDLSPFRIDRPALL